MYKLYYTNKFRLLIFIRIIVKKFNYYKNKEIGKI